MNTEQKKIRIKTLTGIAEFASPDRANDYIQSRAFQSLLIKFIEYDIQRHIDVRHQNPTINLKIKKVAELLKDIKKDVQYNFKDAEGIHEEYLDYNADMYMLFRDMMFRKDVRLRFGKLYDKIKNGK